MREIVARGRRLFSSEDGPTTDEYAVMLAGVVLFVVAAIHLVGDKVGAFFMTVAEAIGRVV